MSKTQPIVWHNSFNIGIPEIDFQHKELVRFFNDANHLMRVSVDLAGWDAIAYDLLRYALYHFYSEEKLAEQYGYDKESPDQSRMHQAEHKAFITHIEEVRASLTAGSNVTQTDIMDFIHDWLINHISHDDVPLGDFIRKKQTA